MDAVAAVGLYLLATLPLLALLVTVLAQRREETRMLVAGLILQLLPVGLLFLPFGSAGVLVLGYTLLACWRRNRQFRASGLVHPALERRWSADYLTTLVALGLAIEQKAMAWLFLEVVSQRGFYVLWHWILPLSGLLWTLLLVLAAHERRTIRKRT